MADYTMTKGMADWNVPYNNFVKDNLISDTGWTSDGLTYLNGFKLSTGDPIEYRVMDFGKVKFVCLGGYITGAALTAPNKVVFAQLPTSIGQLCVDSKIMVGRGSMRGQNGTFGISADGKITLAFYGDSKMGASDGIWLDIINVVTNK